MTVDAVAALLVERCRQDRVAVVRCRCSPAQRDHASVVRGADDRQPLPMLDPFRSPSIVDQCVQGSGECRLACRGWADNDRERAEVQRDVVEALKVVDFNSGQHASVLRSWRDDRKADGL